MTAGIFHCGIRSANKAFIEYRPEVVFWKLQEKNLIFIGFRMGSLQRGHRVGYHSFTQINSKHVTARGLFSIR